MTAIVSNFRFRNFQEALRFVRNAGDLAETEGHHPDVSFGWGYATISLRTKKMQGLHEKRFYHGEQEVGVLFGIFACTTLVFGSHQGIRSAVTRCSVLMVRGFDRSRPTFMMSGQSPKRLLMLTAW
jgi:pterin 4 alpha carbinolamine dehydratase